MALSYSEKIKKIRESLGMKQEELANLLGITQQHISRLENPNNTKRLKRSREATLIKIANLSPGYFDEDFEIDRLSNEELLYILLPEAKEAELSIQDIRNILKPIASLKVSEAIRLNKTDKHNTDHDTKLP